MHYIFIPHIYVSVFLVLRKINQKVKQPTRSKLTKHIPCSKTITQARFTYLSHFLSANVPPLKEVTELGMKVLGRINMARGEYSAHRADEYFRRHIDASRAIFSFSLLFLSLSCSHRFVRSHARADNSLIYDKLDRAAHGPHPLPLPHAINHFRV